MNNKARAAAQRSMDRQQRRREKEEKRQAKAARRQAATQGRPMNIAKVFIATAPFVVTMNIDFAQIDALIMDLGDDESTEQT